MNKTQSGILFLSLLAAKATLYCPTNISDSRHCHNFLPIIELKGIGPKRRLSNALKRLSPITNKWPAGTMTETSGGRSCVDGQMQSDATHHQFARGKPFYHQRQ